MTMTVEGTHMAQTNAERQAAYRARHLKDVDGEGERLNMVVDTKSKLTLKRLAIRYGVTQRDVLEGLIDDAEKALLKKLSSAEQAEYYDSTVTR
jgi:predicted Zn-dependent protease